MMSRPSVQGGGRRQRYRAGNSSGCAEEESMVQAAVLCGRSSSGRGLRPVEACLIVKAPKSGSSPGELVAGSRGGGAAVTSRGVVQEGEPARGRHEYPRDFREGRCCSLKVD